MKFVFMRLYSKSAVSRVEITERVNEGRTKIVKFTFDKFGNAIDENRHEAQRVAMQIRSYFYPVFAEENNYLIQVGWGIPK